MFAGVAPAVLALIALYGTLLAFPIYFWIQDRRRRGERLATWWLLGPALIGLLGALATLLFLLAKP
jgi:hypothetical protein